MKYLVISLLVSASAFALTQLQQDQVALLQDQVKMNADKCAAIESPTQVQTLQCNLQAAQGALAIYQAKNPPAPRPSPSPSQSQ